MIEPIRMLVARDRNSGSLLSPQHLKALASRGWELLEPALTDESALAALETGAADLCVLDRTDGGSAIGFLAAARSRGCRVPIVAVVAAGEERLADQMMEAGAGDVLLETEFDHARLQRVIGNARDRARAAEALRASWRRFRALLEHCAEGVLVLDDAGKVRYANDAVRELFGCWSHELIGKYLFDFAHPDDAWQAVHLFEDAAKLSPQPAAGRFRIQYHGGGWRHLDWVMADRIEDPDVRGVVVNCRDITEQHWAFEQMTRATRQLDRRQRAWSALMGVVQVLHQGFGERRELLDAIIRALSPAWAEDEPVGIRFVTGTQGSSTAVPSASSVYRGTFGLPEGQTACLEVLTSAVGDGPNSIEYQELVDAVCSMLQWRLSAPVETPTDRAANRTARAEIAARGVGSAWLAAPSTSKVM